MMDMNPMKMIKMCMEMCTGMMKNFPDMMKNLPCPMMQGKQEEHEKKGEKKTDSASTPESSFKEAGEEEIEAEPTLTQETFVEEEDTEG